MELSDCSACNATTHEWIDIDEQAVCGACVKDVLVPVYCSLCDGDMRIFMSEPTSEQSPVYCLACINHLEKERHREADDHRHPRYIGKTPVFLVSSTIVSDAAEMPLSPLTKKIKSVK